MSKKYKKRKREEYEKKNMFKLTIFIQRKLNLNLFNQILDLLQNYLEKMFANRVILVQNLLISLTVHFERNIF